MNEKDPHRYDDIIDLPRFISSNRHHMSSYDRAAQFAPFDALEGFDEEMEETSRLTDNEIILSENELQALDQKFQIISKNIKVIGEIMITYFEPDLYKDGGRYLDKQIIVKRFDLSRRMIISNDNERFYLDYIIDVQSDYINRYLENL